MTSELCAVTWGVLAWDPKTLIPRLRAVQVG